MSDKEKSPKKKTSSNSVKELLAPVAHFFHQHLGMLFTLFALGALLYAAFATNHVLQESSASSTDTSSEYSTRFNEKTVTKINNLGNAQQAPITLPGVRINPFSE